MMFAGGVGPIWAVTTSLTDGMDELETSKMVECRPAAAVAPVKYLPKEQPKVETWPLEERWRTAVATSRPPVPQKRRPIKNLTLNSWYIEKFFGFLYPREALWIYSFLTTCLVAPLTVITPLEREYQQYLLEIFHIKPFTRIAHACLTPFITGSYLLMAAAYFPTVFEPASCSTSWITCAAMSVRMNLLVALVFLIWWAYWAIRTKTYALIGLMFAWLAVLWPATNLYAYYWIHSWAHHWWNEPAVIGMFLAALQMMSHAAEGTIPPRVNETDRWMSLTEFRSLHSGWHCMVVIGPAGVWGTLSEFVASPRIFPMQQLGILYWFGYKAEQKRELDQLVRQALKDQNPALDYVGSGGSLPPVPQGPPRSLAAAQEELEHLSERAARNRGHVDEDEFARMEYLRELIAKATAPLPDPSCSRTARPPSPRPFIPELPLARLLREEERGDLASPRSRN